MLIQNAVMITTEWPKQVFLVSSHRHDYRTYTFADGSTVSVDGGLDYVRRGFSTKGLASQYGVAWVEYNLDSTEPFSVIKHKLLWGTRGVDGKQPLTYVRLFDCTSKHLQAILDYPYPPGKQLSPIHAEVIKDILMSDRGIVVKSSKHYIHKGKRPLYKQINPALCQIESKSRPVCRTRWANVTCPECLRRRKHNDW